VKLIGDVMVLITRCARCGETINVEVSGKESLSQLEHYCEYCDINSTNQHHAIVPYHGNTYTSSRITEAEALTKLKVYCKGN
jgi:hypothetical protein